MDGGSRQCLAPFNGLFGRVAGAGCVLRKAFGVVRRLERLKVSQKREQGLFYGALPDRRVLIANAVNGEGNAASHMPNQLSSINAVLSLVRGLDVLQHWSQISDVARVSREVRRRQTSKDCLIRRSGWAKEMKVAVALVIGLVICASALAQVNDALWRYQTNPQNHPGAIVSAMLARDLKNLGRYTGWTEVEYTPLFESFPPYIVTRTKGDDGQMHEREEVPTFGRCAQQMIVKSAKVTKVEQAPDPLSAVNAPRGLKNDVLVTVKAEVLALQLDRQDEIPENERCSWLGLKVQNTQTGKTESYFDYVDNDRALLQMMKQFGTLKGNYVIVDPHRRQWEYAVSMRLPFTGKGERRHFQQSDPNESGKFVDAVEPRWLIQDPYPPEAWHIDSATKQLERRKGGGTSDALKYCRLAMSKAYGLQFEKVQVNLESDVCTKSTQVQKYLLLEQSLSAALVLLQQIK